MTKTGSRLGSGRYVALEALSDDITITVHQLDTVDDAKTSGVLYSGRNTRMVLCLMHPRQDVTHHPMVPILANAGYSVWTQGTRSVNNDLNLVHEQALLDVAAGLAFLRKQGFETIIPVGISGGAALYGFYLEQSGLPPGRRIEFTPAGRPTRLNEADLPRPDAMIFIAPHPGQGQLLLGCIDGSVADEADPLSVVPELDPFNPANGFAEPPASSSYSAAFLARYRKAQHDRVARIDAVAHQRVNEAAEARARFKYSEDVTDRRAAIIPRLITVFRTDADPRSVDLSLEPNDRRYGSLFGRRPDLTNYGLVGFGRLTTPEAWLSTWSGLSSNAGLMRCAPGVDLPTLFIELSGDQATFPADNAAMFDALGAVDKVLVRVRATHFGASMSAGEQDGNTRAGRVIRDWLAGKGL